MWRKGVAAVCLLVAIGLVAGCKLFPAYESGSSAASAGSAQAIPDEAGLRQRVAGYWAAAATGNGPAMWPYMLGSVAKGGEQEFYSRTDLPRAPSQVRIAGLASVSVHSDIWGVKPQAMAHVTMEAYDPQQSAWRKLKQVDTWYQMNGQWYIGKGM